MPPLLLLLILVLSLLLAAVAQAQLKPKVGNVDGSLVLDIPGGALFINDMDVIKEVEAEYSDTLSSQDDVSMLLREYELNAVLIARNSDRIDTLRANADTRQAFITQAADTVSGTIHGHARAVLSTRY